MSRQKLLEIAVQELGETEQPPRSNRNKYGKWYGWDGYAWCAMFVSWIYDKAGIPLGHIEDNNGYRSCQGGYRYWKSKSRLTTAPNPGDIVLYDWQGDGYCDHTGIFEEWVKKEDTFMSIEGNTALGNDSNGGMVMRRKRSVASVKAFVSPLNLPGAIVPQSTNVQRGEKGSRVSSLQKMLYDLDYDITVDGDFGPGTERALKAFQKDMRVAENGISTPLILGLLEDALHKKAAARTKLTQGSYLRKGTTGLAVVMLQKALNKKLGKGTIDVDGVFGIGTEKELKRFQKIAKIDVDGVAGPDTFTALGIREIG